MATVIEIYEDGDINVSAAAVRKIEVQAGGARGPQGGTDIVNDTTPQLGGPLKTNGYYIDFEQIATPPYLRGRLWYSSDTDTLTFYPKYSDVAVQLSQELHTPARNVTGSLIPDGSSVYISGSTGDDPQISLAQAIPEVPILLGVTTHDIDDNDFGLVTTFGRVNNVDTSAFLAGDTLYLSETVPGGFQTTKPVLPNEAVEIGVVIKASVAGIMFVNPHHVYLHNLADDPNPKLGGNLDGDDKEIQKASYIPRQVILASGSLTVTTNVDNYKTTSASNCSLVLPLNTTEVLPLNKRFDALQFGAGVLSITGETGVTINGVLNGSIDVVAQYEVVTFFRTDTNSYIVVGGKAP
jgi:hypothetical protein